MLPELLQAQSLQVALSPAPKVNRTTSGGTATIFFDSNIEDLSIVCTEEDPNESVIKINDHQWFVNIDVNKDIEVDGVCYRNYLLKCSASAEYYLSTDEITPNQVLYYTITLPNELEPKLLEEKAKNISERANRLIDRGNSYLARLLAYEVLQPKSPYTPEAEGTLRRSWETNSAKIMGHTEWVNSAEFNPDGSLMASASNDNTVRIWNTKDGKLLGTLEGHSDGVNYAVFSPDENYIVSASADSTIRIWDAKSYQTVKVLRGHNKPVNSVFFSPDGNYFVSASDDKTIKIWRAYDGRKMRTIDAHSSEVLYASYSPNGKYIVSSSWDNSARVWDSNKGILLATLNGHDRSVNSANFSPDGNYIVTASNDENIIIWDFPDLDELLERTKKLFNNRTLTQEERQLYDLDFEGQ